MKMDPGSWEVTIDGLIATLGTTSHSVVNFIRVVRSARADLVQVTRELSDLRLELELLRDEHNVPPQIQSRGLAVLDSCGVVLRRIGSLLGNSSSRDPARPPRWSVKERFATSNLCNCLQTYREALTLLPDVATLRSSKEGAESEPQNVDTSEVEEKSNQILEAVDDLREAIPQAEPAIAESRPALELYLNEVANYTNAVCNYFFNSDGAELPASYSTPPDDMAPAVKQPMAPVSATQTRLSPQQDAPGTGVNPSTAGASPASDGPLEAVGPWFPTSDLPVPFYHNQEQPLQHRTNSFHVPRSPAPHLPLPRPPPQSPPPLPPPKRALPMLPPRAPQPKTQRHIAELAGTNAPDVRHVAQRHVQYPAPMQPDNHRDLTASHNQRQRNPTNEQILSHQNADYAYEAAKRNGSISAHDFPQPPNSAPHDTWQSSHYVPSTPPSTSGQSSQRTSFQPSSLDSAPSRDTYRSSTSTGPLSTVDSLSPHASPRTRLQPAFESIPALRPPSPQPSTTTSRSSGSNGAKVSSLMDRIPGVFRAKRRSLQSSADSRQTTFRNSASSGSSSTIDPPHNAALIRRSERQIELVPAEGLSDDKGSAIHHTEISPTGAVIATQHANNTVKVWSITTGAVDGVIKYSSKVQPGPRSRMYFIRPHAILSETQTLVAITTSFGNTIEIWNWTKKKRVQSIDHAARWACYPGDIFDANMRPLAVYRSDSDRIDLYTASRDAKKPLVESRRIILKNAGLPFVPQFPDLAYSATGPLLVGAAGPRPGAPPEAQQCILLAWQIDEQQGENPQPYRWLVPEHAELSGALPASLATYGSVAVSIWFPANYRNVITSRGESKKVPIATPNRHVLVWDLATNRTRFFSIPNVLSCISPDCRYVAYCCPEQNRFVVLDVTSGVEVWSGPDELDLQQGGAAAASQQLFGDLGKVTEFRFTDDGGLLYVADQEGEVGIYEVRQAGGGRAGSVSTASGGVAGAYGMAEMRGALSRTRSGDART